MTKNFTTKFVFTVLTATLFSTTLCAQSATQWTDITDRFIINSTFDTDNDTSGWTYETTSGTVGVAQGNMRFYSGSFNFYQQLKKLPKGHYRLSVQTFYRDGGTDASYNAYLNGTESLSCYLYAGNTEQPVVSIYSESLSYNAEGRCWTPNNQDYYPDGRNAAGVAFDEGLYWNSMDFDAKGDVTIGIRCNDNKNSNYCVIDNFVLEYYGDPDSVEPDADGWTDVTRFLLTNTEFDDDNADGWSWECSSQDYPKFQYGCMEFWNSTFNLWQQLNGLPNGHYRLSVQAYYRVGDNNATYQQHQDGTENITAFLYAGTNRQKLVSLFAFEYDENMSGTCWTPNSSWWGSEPPYFPNGMSSGYDAFERGDYWNTMEFDGGGDLRIGLVCANRSNGNWCMFDNFKLEYKGNIVKATSITATIADSEILIGQQTQASVTILPANAMSKRASWTSSDENVAIVDENGLVKGINRGSAIITATTIDGTKLSSSITVQVMKNSPTSESLIINEIMVSNVDEYLSPAFNFDGFVELYNPSDMPVSLSGIYVSLDANNLAFWQAPDDMPILPAHGYQLLWFDSNSVAHTNVPTKLDVDGGTVYICDENGQLLASQIYPTAMERVSYARLTDGGTDWGLTATATPGASNTTSTFATSQLAAPVVNQPDQLFTSSFSVHVTIPTGTTLRYTTDGTLPTLQNGNTSSNGNFTVSSTTVFRFRLFADGKLPSNVTSRSYIYDDRGYTGPILSVVTDPDFLYSSEIGVMTTGPNGRPGNGQDANCNWNMDWERPVNFSYMPNGEGLSYTLDKTFNQDANLEMCGGWSRAWSPHSFKLKGSKELGGSKTLDFPFFEAKPYIRNRTLQIRNGGNDTSCRIKDGALQTIVHTSGLFVDGQSMRPVHEFINGQYIGVLNMREPNNKHFVFANYGWDDDIIDMFEMSPDSGYVQKCGTDEQFEALVNLSYDAADDAVYDEICRRLEIDEYINYMAVEFYLGSNDWPQNNVKGFRHREDGRFHFVLFDLDHAFNSSTPFNTFMNKEYDYGFDQLRPASLGRIWEDIHFVTLFKNLLQNDRFRRDFIDAFCIMGGSVFEKNRAAAIIDSVRNVMKPMMQLKRESPDGTANTLINNLNSRMNSMTNHLASYNLMQLSGVAQKAVKISSNEPTGRLYINNTWIPTSSFDGYLFAPVTVRAEAPAGYFFRGWANENGTIFTNNASYSLPTSGSTITLKAIFDPLTGSRRISPVRINEVSASNDVFISDYYKRSDWLELYNTTDQPIDIEGWTLINDGSKLQRSTITSGSTQANTVIPAHGHIIIWCDKNAPVNQLHADFKLAAEGGRLFLKPADGSWHDEFFYPAHDANCTAGRYPDGTDQTYLFQRATMATANMLNIYAAPYSDPGTTTATDPALLMASQQLSLRALPHRLVLRTNASANATLTIHKASGQLVTTQTLSLSGGLAEFSTDGMQPGYYVAKVTTENGQTTTCKFICRE